MKTLEEFIACPDEECFCDIDECSNPAIVWAGGACCRFHWPREDPVAVSGVIFSTCLAIHTLSVEVGIMKGAMKKMLELLQLTEIRVRQLESGEKPN